jgi:thiamine-monophosphate kinase
MHEKDIISLFRGRDPRALDFDDDVCLLDDHGLVCSTDMVVEDVDFRMRTFSPEDIAYKALAVALSDLAAAGATPIGFVSALAFGALPDDFMQAFSLSLKACAKAWNCALLGGDISKTQGPFVATMTVFGRTERVLRRRQTKVGDALLVSGELGAAAAGLRALEANLEWPRLVRKQRRPEPRLSLGAFLAQQPSVRGAMDLSDGLAADLPRFVKAGQGGWLKSERLPIADDTRAHCDDALSLAVRGGEDFELLCACSASQAESLIADAKRQGHTLSVIGEVTADSVFRLDDANLGEGFDHFRA